MRATIATLLIILTIIVIFWYFNRPAAPDQANMTDAHGRLFATLPHRKLPTLRQARNYVWKYRPQKVHGRTFTQLL